mmetsp:Transcript_7077/g.17231  ORF Transcript_7077/g.17231 Transcript_7077/m.17231 type:complete len:227 (-) Transcript_7077:693-1373(-)
MSRCKRRSESSSPSRKYTRATFCNTPGRFALFISVRQSGKKDMLSRHSSPSSTSILLMHSCNTRTSSTTRPSSCRMGLLQSLTVNLDSGNNAEYAVQVTPAQTCPSSPYRRHFITVLKASGSDASTEDSCLPTRFALAITASARIALYSSPSPKVFFLCARAGRSASSTTFFCTNFGRTDSYVLRQLNAPTAFALVRWARPACPQRHLRASTTPSYCTMSSAAAGE